MAEEIIVQIRTVGDKQFAVYPDGQVGVIESEEDKAKEISLPKDSPLKEEEKK